MGRDSLDQSMQALARDVSFLGRVLGDVLQEQGGKQLFEAVEGLRVACRDRRRSGEARWNGILDRVEALSLPLALDVVRAFTAYFHLINMAEESHRLRRIAEREAASWPEPREESISAAIKSLHEAGASEEEVWKLLEALCIRPVFTAHPTEARRMTLLGHLTRISHLVADLSSPGITPQRRERLTKHLYGEVTNLWQTNELRTRRQSPLDEVRNGLFYLESSVFDVVPRLYRDLEEALARWYPALAGRFFAFLSFGSWIGGDRDGNPSVTPDVSEETLQMHRRAALDLYAARVEQLIGGLTSSASLAGVSDELQQSIEHDAHDFGVAGKASLERRGDEPYRQKLAFMLERLRRSAAEFHPGYESADDFIADLQLIASSLQAHRAGRIAAGPLQDLITQARVFRFHLASLDVRQHRDRHLQALDDLLPNVGGRTFSQLEEAGKVQLLHEALDRPEPFSASAAEVAGPGLPAATAETLELFCLIKRMQDRLGREALDTYIVSFTQSPSDILAVLYLARLAGLFDPGAVTSTLRLVPLFETEEDLRSAPRIMAELWQDALYRKQLEAWRGEQEVMLGYSDSDKDVGYVTSNWMLYRVQEDLTREADRAGIRLTFFHGRGGAIGRGGGPLQRAIAGQPPGATRGRIKVTEQGEVLFTRYANPGIAHRHLEQVTSAMIGISARDSRVGREPSRSIPRTYRDLVDRLSQNAAAAYRELIDDQDFLPFFEEATPLRSIVRLRIASRPAKRRAGPLRFGDLRAIPWVFAWTQSRWGLPGWYGLGSALLASFADGKEGMAREMYSDWPFFRWLVDASQISLGKADLGVALQYARLAPDPAVRERYTNGLRDEYLKTVEAVNRTIGQKRLLDSWPTLQRSIELRDPYVDPMSMIQVRAIREVRETPDEEAQAILRQIIDRTVTGIAAGLQNTG